MSYVSAAFLGCSTWQRGGGALSSQESHEELKKHSAAVEEADGNIVVEQPNPRGDVLGKGWTLQPQVINDVRSCPRLGPGR